MNIKWLITPVKLLIHTPDKQQIAMKKTDPLYKRVLGLLTAGKHDKAMDMLLPAKRVEKYSKNEFSVDSIGQVFLAGDEEPVHQLIAEKLLEFSKTGNPYQSLIKFWKNLKQNPSQESVKDLYDFLTVNKHPITEDGYFLAYKAVNKDEDGKLVDMNSGTFINNIGQRVEMKREDVNADRNVTCSTGLHVASFDYAWNSFGGRNNTMVLVMVNPKDVVAVPPDYNQQKMRCCEYTVIGIDDHEIELTYLSNANIVNNIRESLKVNQGFSFEYMYINDIVKLVKTVTGEEIKVGVRSKESIVKDAEEIFRKHELLLNRSY